VRGRAGERGWAVMGTDRWAQAAQCRAAWLKPVLKQIPNSNLSNKSQASSNFGQLEKYFLGLRKIKIKYGFKGLGRHFLRFGMGLKLKFREFSMC
jgi:hypothetical protein